MDGSDSSSAIWEDIELSESYLICSMYEEASSLAFSVIKRIKARFKEAMDDSEMEDMMESGGLVLVQSLSQLGRGSEIPKKLQELFGSAEAVPVQVLLTGACLQISEGSSAGVREFLEEFLKKWRYMEGKYYVLVGAEADMDVEKGCNRRHVLGVDEYIKVVEVYVVVLLGMTLNDFDIAISWVEKAALPEESRQVLVRRLHSLYSRKATNKSHGSSVIPEHNHEIHFSSPKELEVSKGSPKVLKTNYLPNGDNDTKQAIMKLSRRIDPCLWWYRSIKLKYGDAQLVITNGKIAVGCLIVLVLYVLRRKKTNLKRIVTRQVMSIKKGLVDLWQLAFSYQVNPLAAVQPLPAATRGG